MEVSSRRVDKQTEVERRTEGNRKRVDVEEAAGGSSSMGESEGHGGVVLKEEDDRSGEDGEGGRLTSRKQKQNESAKICEGVCRAERR